VLSCVLGPLHLIVMPQWRYRVHRWEVTGEAVYTQSGWLKQEWRIAPVSRIQTVDIERDPFEQLFGLAKITVTTASAAGPLRLLGALLFGHGEPWQWIGLVFTAIAVFTGVSHVLTSRYRITESQVEWHTGLLLRKQRAIPRDRIRTVDVTSEPKHRLFSLAAARIGTGRHSHGKGPGKDELLLDAVTLAEAQRLRTILLHRKEVQTSENVGDVKVAPPETLIAVVDKRWLRYAPFTLSGLAVVGAVIGTIYHFAHELHAD